jgi:hypothetical protein
MTTLQFHNAYGEIVVEIDHVMLWTRMQNTISYLSARNSWLDTSKLEERKPLRIRPRI